MLVMLKIVLLYDLALIFTPQLLKGKYSRSKNRRARFIILNLRNVVRTLRTTGPSRVGQMQRSASAI